ncbi:hypothetical protein CBR_g31772 [Chara braunii]|uniref:DUF659 domain-containing protein n=1 Tax=Chara braunii TaxID=69332 RepID=A0A388JYB2_CHABU|nr:hypothetical protein CBR_g31772 [Chara braunii]|eukprot:GBG62755.1 hypothetical protein CBR_g31772 [Chara braunii]
MYRVRTATGIPSQRGKVASMVSEVRSAFRHTGATILSDGRKSRSGKPLVNFLAGGANGALLYATVARDGSVRDTADIVYRRWRAIILSFPAKDVIGFCIESASYYMAAARRFATDEDPSIRRITWLHCSSHVCNLILSDIRTRVGWVKDTIIRDRSGEDVEPEVWGARPAGIVREQAIQQQVVAFHDSRLSRARAVQDVFGQRATELRPWPEAVGDGPDSDADGGDPCDEWTDDDDAPVSGDTTTERVYFTYGGGPDGMDSHTSVITDDVSSIGQASGTGRGGGRRGRRPSAADVLELEPRGGLRMTGRRWEVRSDSEHEREAEEEEVPRQDRRYSPSHHRTTTPPEALRPSERMASTAGRERTYENEEREGERTPSGSGIRPRSPSELCRNDFDVGHTVTIWTWVAMARATHRVTRDGMSPRADDLPLVEAVATARPRVMRDRVPPCVAGERVDPVEMGIPQLTRDRVPTRVVGETMDPTEMMTTTTVARTMRIGSPWS